MELYKDAAERKYYSNGKGEIVMVPILIERNDKGEIVYLRPVNSELLFDVENTPGDYLEDID